MAKRSIFSDSDGYRDGFRNKENAREKQKCVDISALDVFPPLQRAVSKNYQVPKSSQELPLRNCNRTAAKKLDWAEIMEDEDMKEQYRNASKQMEKVEPVKHQDARSWKEEIKKQEKKRTPVTWGVMYKEELVIDDARQKVYRVARYRGDANRDKTYQHDCTASLEDIRISKDVVTSTPSKQLPKEERTPDGKESSKRAVLFEYDTNVLKRRQKQIDYGKNTLGYQNYVSSIQKSQRTKNDPRTPEKKVKYSRNSWDMQIKLWRKKLHNWDPPSNDQGNESGDMDFDISSEISLDISDSFSAPPSSSSPDCLEQEDIDIGYGGSSPFLDINMSQESDTLHDHDISQK